MPVIKEVSMKQELFTDNIVYLDTNMFEMLWKLTKSNFLCVLDDDLRCIGVIGGAEKNYLLGVPIEKLRE